MKRFIASVAGFGAGFLATALLSLLTTTVLRSLWPRLGMADQGPGLEALDFTYAVLYMGVGCYLAARIAGRGAAIALGAVYVALGLATAGLQLDDQHSSAYQWLLALLAGPAAWTGMRAAMRRR